MPRTSGLEAGGGNTSEAGSRGDATTPALAKKVSEVARLGFVRAVDSAVSRDASFASLAAGSTDVLEVVVLNEMIPGLLAGAIVEEDTKILIAHPPAWDAQDVIEPSLLGRGDKRVRLIGRELLAGGGQMGVVGG